MCILKVCAEERDKTISSITLHKMAPKENIYFIIILGKRTRYLNFHVIISLVIEFLFLLPREKWSYFDAWKENINPKVATLAYK